MSKERELFNAAIKVQKNAYAPYSNFLVGAALRSSSGKIYTGCNVVNIAYPEGTCAEAGAIASMIAGGDREIKELTVVADSSKPVAPCGGWRQKISEFGSSSIVISLATTSGEIISTSLGELLPGAFDESFMKL